MSLVLMITGTNAIEMVAQLHGIIRIDFQIVEIPPPVERHQTEHPAANLQCERIRPERASLCGMWQRQPVFSHCLDIHFSLCQTIRPDCE